MATITVLSMDSGGIRGLISLGTGNLDHRIPYAKAKDWGLAGWARSLIDSNLQDREQPLDSTDPENLLALERHGQAVAQGPRFDEVCSRLLEIQTRRRSPAA